MKMIRQEAEEGEVIETSVVHEKNNSVPSSYLLPSFNVNEDRGYTLEKSKSSDEQRLSSSSENNHNDDEIEEGKIQDSINEGSSQVEESTPDKYRRRVNAWRKIHQEKQLSDSSDMDISDSEDDGEIQENDSSDMDNSDSEDNVLEISNLTGVTATDRQCMMIQQLQSSSPLFSTPCCVTSIVEEEIESRVDRSVTSDTEFFWNMAGSLLPFLNELSTSKRIEVFDILFGSKEKSGSIVQELNKICPRIADAVRTIDAVDEFGRSTRSYDEMAAAAMDPFDTMISQVTAQAQAKLQAQHPTRMDHALAAAKRSRDDSFAAAAVLPVDQLECQLRELKKAKTLYIDLNKLRQVWMNNLRSLNIKEQQLLDRLVDRSTPMERALEMTASIFDKAEQELSNKLASDTNTLLLGSSVTNNVHLVVDDNTILTIKVEANNYLDRLLEPSLDNMSAFRPAIDKCREFVVLRMGEAGVDMDNEESQSKADEILAEIIRDNAIGRIQNAPCRKDTLSDEELDDHLKAHDMTKDDLVRQREETKAKLRSHESYKDDPISSEFLCLAIDELLPGDWFYGCICLCGVQFARFLYDLQNGGSALCGCDLADCASIANMMVLDECFVDSPIVWGSHVKNIIAWNIRWRCPITGKVYQHCPICTEDEGGILAGRLDIFGEGCDDLGIARFYFSLAGTNSEVVEHALKKITPSPYQSTCEKTCHISTFSAKVDKLSLKAQALSRINVLKAIDSELATFRHAHGIYDAMNLSFVETLLTTALNSKRLSFITYDFDRLEKLFPEEFSVDGLVKSLVLRSNSHEFVPLLGITGLPQQTEDWIKRNVVKLLKHHDLNDKDDLRIFHALSLLGSNGHSKVLDKYGVTAQEFASWGGRAVVSSGNKYKFTYADNSKGGSCPTRQQVTRKSLLDVDFSETGVYQDSRNGKWGVEVHYQLKARRIGTYDTQDEAASANETARRSLEPTVNDVLTPEGITANVTLAKEAAHLAVHGTPDIFAGFDFTTGVKQLPSGNWNVVISYYGTQRSYGTYETQDEGALANEAARRSFEETRNEELSADDIEANIALAKKAAQEEVYGV